MYLHLPHESSRLIVVHIDIQQLILVHNVREAEEHDAERNHEWSDRRVYQHHHQDHHQLRIHPSISIYASAHR